MGRHSRIIEPVFEKGIGKPKIDDSVGTMSTWLTLLVRFDIWNNGWTGEYAKIADVTSLSVSPPWSPVRKSIDQDRFLI